MGVLWPEEVLETEMSHMEVINVYGSVICCADLCIFVTDGLTGSAL